MQRWNGARYKAQHVFSKRASILVSHRIARYRPMPYSIDIIHTRLILTTIQATTYLIVEESFPKIFYYLTSWSKLAQYIARDCRQQLICGEDTFILNSFVIVVRTFDRLPVL